MLYTGAYRLRPALMTDLYQLTMVAGHYVSGTDKTATFELSVRSLPARRGYLVAAGLELAVEALTHLAFGPDEVDHVRSLAALRHMPSGFFEYLAALRFEGDVWGVPEGTPVFANEPILQVRAPLPQAQLVETFLLSVIHAQTLIATKASRVVQAAEGKGVIDFGTRRAHGPEAGVLAARACFVGGCIGSSNVEAGRLFGIPAYGTAAHSWTLAFDSEMEAFERYHEAFPDSTVLLIDTYDTQQGLRNAMRFGDRLKGVRLDSGDLGSQARTVRRVLDDAGLKDTRILASGDLNEERIGELVRSGAPIDLFGVGTEMVTSRDEPALGVIYKLVEKEESGRRIFCAKLSEGKWTYPGRKQVWRSVLPDGTYGGDCIATEDEAAPAATRPLLRRVMEDGKVIRPFPALEEVRQRSLQEVDRLPLTCRRLSPEQAYPLRRSDRLEQRMEALRRERAADGGGPG